MERGNENPARWNSEAGYPTVVVSAPYPFVVSAPLNYKVDFPDYRSAGFAPPQLSAEYWISASAQGYGDSLPPAQSAAELWRGEPPQGYVYVVPSQLAAPEWVAMSAEGYGDWWNSQNADWWNSQKLLNQRLPTNFWGLSRQRAKFQYVHDLAHAALDGFESSLQSHDESLDDSLIEPAGPCYWENEHNRQVLLQILDYSVPTVGGTEPSPVQRIVVSVLNAASQMKVCLYLKQLVRRLFIWIQQADKLMFQLIPTPTFCGVSWSKRAWFVLHGCRSPKAPELGRPIDLTFGCA